MARRLATLFCYGGLPRSTVARLATASPEYLQYTTRDGARRGDGGSKFHRTTRAEPAKTLKCGGFRCMIVTAA